MKPTQIMIRYGDLSTKGKNINTFIEQLGRNVINALKPKFPEVTVNWNRSRMYVDLNGENSDEVVERLKDIFGIANISPVLQVEKTLEAAKEGAIAIVRPLVKDGASSKLIRDEQIMILNMTLWI